MMPYVYLKLIDLHDNNRFGSDQAISRDFFLGLLVKINFIFLILTKNKAVLLITKTQLHFDQQRRNVLVVLRPGYTHTLEGLASSQNSLQRPIGLRSRPLFESEGRGGSSVFKAGLAVVGLSCLRAVQTTASKARETRCRSCKEAQAV